MIDFRNTIDKIVHHRAFVPASVGAVSVSFGLGAGYVLGAKRTEIKLLAMFQQYLDNMTDLEQPEEVDENQMRLDFEVTQEQYEAARAAGHPSVRDETGRHEPPHLQIVDPEPAEVKVLPHKPDQTPGRTNVFRAQEDWDQDREEALRSESEPYILSKDEFFAHQREDEGYLQEQMTYYNGDDILTDSGDVPQYDHERMVGLMRFGHGSGEAGVVYVRNPMLKMEYEIHLNIGTYEHEVLGDELDVPDEEPAVPKFRE